MIRFQKTKAIKRLSKNIRSKRGATLVELIATVAILSIVASLSLQAIIVAAEESQRVKIISESQRAISLIEQQINTYARNATRIDMVTYNVPSTGNINNAITSYVNDRNLDGDPFHDDEVDESRHTKDDDGDYILYWSGEGATANSKGFNVTLAKFDKDEITSNKFKKIIHVDNIKELNFKLRRLQSDNGRTTNHSYVLDYTLISPTGFEIIDQTVDSTGASANSGAYSVFSGVVLNNLRDSLSASGDILKISKPVEESDGSKNYCFIIFRTVKVAK